MRNILALIACVVMLNSTTSAQAKKDLLIIKPHELRGNGLWLLAKTLDISYEYAYRKHNSLGLVAVLPVSDFAGYDYAGGIYHRTYFGGRGNSGFFVEINAAVVSVYKDWFDEDDSGIETMLGAGMATGFKGFFEETLVIDLTLGVGRTIGELDIIYPRLGAHLGFLF